MGSLSEQALMRAIEYSRFGGPEVLQLRQVPRPEPAAGQVRVAVRAAGVNPLDWKLREGLFGEQPLPQRPGLELAGVVDAAGANAPAAVGDPVFGWALTGAYADFALAEVVAGKPLALSWCDAAGLPVAGEAAVRSLHDLAVQPGEVLLIHGAGGSVGSLATQLARAAGVTVIGTGATANAEYLSRLGAIPVSSGEGLVDRVRQLVPRVDAVLDAAGFGELPDLLALCSNRQRIITLADPAASGLGIRFSSSTPGSRNSETLARLAGDVTAGRLHIRHDSSYPLSRAAVAQEAGASGRSHGKITLTMAS